MRSLIERFKNIDVVNLSSNEINTCLEAITNDIINAYNQASEKTEMLKKINTLLSYENQTLYRELNEIKALINDINTSTGQTTQQHKTYYSVDDIEILDGQINTEYGYISPLTETHQKVNYSRYPIEFLLSKFQIDVKIFKHFRDQISKPELIESFSIKDEPDLINLCNNQDSDFFLHNTECDASTEFLSYELYIGLPKDIMPNLMVNVISVNPLLSSGLLLDSVSFLSNGQYVQIPEIANTLARKERYLIDPVYSNYFKFVFYQSSYQELNGKRIFTFGLRDINLNSLAILSNTIEWVSKYSVMKPGCYFKSIDVPVVESNGQYSKLTSELFLDESLTKKAEYNTEIAYKTSTIYIKYKLTALASHIPLVYGDSIAYETRS